MIERTAKGLYCRAADAWVDPWRPVPRALITHAHADHARAGCGEYWAVDVSEGVLRQRLGQEICLHPVRYGEPIWLGQCRVSFHSAGHVLGSACRGRGRLLRAKTLRASATVGDRRAGRHVRGGESIELDLEE